MTKLFKTTSEDKNIIKLAVTLIIVSTFLALLLTGFARSIIMTPFIYAFWIGRIVYETLPQLFWWILILMGLSIFAINNVLKLRRWSRQTKPEESRQLSHLETWTETLEQANKGGYFQWSLANQLAHVTIKVLANQEHIPKNQATLSLKNGQFNLPPEVHSYLITGLDASRSFKIEKSQIRLFANVKENPLNLDPERVITCIEEYLDIEQPEQSNLEIVQSEPHNKS